MQIEGACHSHKKQKRGAQTATKSANIENNIQLIHQHLTNIRIDYEDKIVDEIVNDYVLSSS